MTSSSALLRCSGCGYGVAPALEFCPECGERQQPPQRGWREKLFGEPIPRRPGTCHREIERRANTILDHVRQDLDRFEQQHLQLSERVEQAHAAGRPTAALDKSRSLIAEAIASRRRIAAQCHVALADLRVDRLGNTIDLWAQLDAAAPEDAADLDWRRAANTHSLPATSSVPVFAVSPEGRWLAASTKDGLLRVWALSQHAEDLEVSERDGPLTAMAFTPDGRNLIGGSAGGELLTWDTATWTARERIGQHTGGIRALVVAPDGTWIASAGKDRTIRFWDRAQRSETFSLSGHGEAILSLAVTSNGAWMASGSWDGVLKLWNLRRRVEQGSIAGHSGGILALAFHPDGARLASGGWDKTVRVWSFHKDPSSRLIGAHGLGVLSLAFSRDGRWLASGGGDGGIKIWSTTDFDERVMLRGGSEPVLQVAFSPSDPGLYASGGEPGIHIWSPLLPPFSRFDEIVEVAQLASLRDVMQCTGGASVVLRAHRLMSRAVQVSLARLARVAAQRGRAATEELPRTGDLEEAADRLICFLRALVVESSLREPLEHEIRAAESVRSDLAGHAMLATAAQLVDETEEQLFDLESADDLSCEQRLERLRACEKRAMRSRASLPSDAARREASATERASASLQRLIDQIPEIMDVVLARQATAMVARVAPIADQQPIVSVRRLHDSLRSELDASGSTEPTVDEPERGAVGFDEAVRRDILSELEKRYQAISSELEAVMEVDDILHR